MAWLGLIFFRSETLEEGYDSPFIREMVAMALGLSQKFTNGLVNELNAKCSKAGKQWVRKDLMCSHCEEPWGRGRGFLVLALCMAVNTIFSHVPISSRWRHKEIKQVMVMSALTYCGHTTQTINLGGRRICLAHGSRGAHPILGEFISLDPSWGC